MNRRSFMQLVAALLPASCVKWLGGGQQVTVDREVSAFEQFVVGDTSEARGALTREALQEFTDLQMAQLPKTVTWPPVYDLSPTFARWAEIPGMKEYLQDEENRYQWVEMSGLNAHAPGSE